MTDLIPYFGGFVTIMFSMAFYWGIQEAKKDRAEKEGEN